MYGIEWEALEMIRTVVPVGLATVLTAAGVMHFIWAFSPWPMKDTVTFTKTIGGTDDGVMPSAASAMMVGLALFGGAVLTLMVNESIPSIGPDWLRLVGMYGLAGVLLARGVGGYFMNSGAAAEFQRWNSVLYSPLCVALGVLGGMVAVAASRRY
ncbi:DUF3995 domain-containing protein [Streptomyces sp. NRRL S-118]|uniref:DUF3995 domain-containing protein n=1 Tax=Streptomyces sp. NRRL S-118 TaxID=1463881 RepID=UPI001F19E2B5|nr:DUF3995 domain-containing protein [Streptomyces sp. NRRL S-118]